MSEYSSEEEYDSRARAKESRRYANNPPRGTGRSQAVGANRRFGNKRAESDSESPSPDRDEFRKSGRLPINEPSRNMGNVIINTKGYRTRLVNESYIRSNTNDYEIQDIGKKELMRVTNTAEVTGIKYRMPVDLVGGTKNNRKSSRRGVSRNGNDL
jgi:hypothetical protein